MRTSIWYTNCHLILATCDCPGHCFLVINVSCYFWSHCFYHGFSCFSKAFNGFKSFYSPSLILLWLSDIMFKLLQESRQAETGLNCSLYLFLLFFIFTSSEDRLKCFENKLTAKTWISLKLRAKWIEFCLELCRNNIFLFLKFIFDIEFFSSFV